MQTAAHVESNGGNGRTSLDGVSKRVLGGAPDKLWQAARPNTPRAQRSIIAKNPIYRSLRFNDWSPRKNGRLPGKNLKRVYLNRYLVVYLVFS